MQQTPLQTRHEALGARLAEFAGWLMPIQYAAGILAEHQHTRENAGLFDICHMGEFRVRGPGAPAALDRLLARPCREQKPGTCRYNFLLSDQGTVRDDLLVYRLAVDEFYLVVNAGTAPADAVWISSQLGAAAEFADESAITAKLDLQGPEAFAVLADLGLPAAEIPGYYSWIRRTFLGVPMLISRTGYTGERGVELYMPMDAVGAVWDRFLAHPLVRPIGLGARDTLRLEMGYPLYGHELDLDTTPVEAGFGALVKTADRDFVGRPALLVKEPVKRLTGLRLDGRRAARAGMAVREAQGRAVIGRVTSGAFAPSLGYAVALAYLQGPAPLPAGTPVVIGDGAALQLSARVAPPPFYPNGTVRGP